MAETPRPPKTRRHLQVSGWRLLGAFTTLTVGVTLLGYLGPFWWPLENLGVFRVQQGALLTLLGLLWLIRRRWLRAASLLALGLVTAAPVARFSLDGGAEGAAATSPRLRLVILNVYTGNRDHGRVRRFLQESRADLVLLQEVNQRWIEALEPLRRDYPSRTLEPRADNFGIALLSRRKPASVRIRYFGDAGVPSVVAQLQLGGRPLTLVGTHLVPPVSGRYVAWRRRQVGALIRFRQGVTTPVVVAGDLNLTERSPAFQRLLAEAKLRDSRPGFGYQPTWPTDLAPLLIPIDHCLVSPEVEVIDRRVGPAVGSDHYPVLVDLAWRREG